VHGLFAFENVSVLVPPHVVLDDSNVPDGLEGVTVTQLSGVPSWNLQRHAPIPSVGKLRELDSDEAKLDFARTLASEPPQYPNHVTSKLTIVMPGYSRRHILVETVSGYCASIGSLIDQVIIVWNNLVRNCGVCLLRSFC
jgi:hypothetical protein